MTQYSKQDLANNVHVTCGLQCHHILVLGALLWWSATNVVSELAGFILVIDGVGVFVEFFKI